MILRDGSVININKALVANIDPLQFINLARIKKQLSSRQRFIPSQSSFMIYLGFEGYDKEYSLPKSCVWNLSPDSNQEPIIKNKAFNFNNEISFDLIFSPSTHYFNKSVQPQKNTLQIFRLVPYISDSFWEKYSDKIYDYLMKRAETIYPFLKVKTLKITATPKTFFNFTLNTKGAILGREHLSLGGKEELGRLYHIFKNVFFAGAWYRYGGVNFAAVSGKFAAQSLVASNLIRIKKWPFKLTKA